MTADGSLWVSVRSGVLRLLDLNRGFEIWSRIIAVEKPVITSDGKRIVGSARGSIILIDAVSGDEVGRITTRGELGAISRDGRFCVVITDDGTFSRFRDWFEVWDLELGARTMSAESRCGRLSAAALSNDGAQAVCRGDVGIEVWDVRAGTSRVLAKSMSPYGDALAITADGTLAACSSESQILDVWDLNTGQQVAAMPGHREYLVSRAERLAVAP